MRLLVTRPQPDADETAVTLKSAGHDVLVDPVIETQFLTPPVPDFFPAALVFTSRNGVRAAAQWPAAEEWRSCLTFAVGAATAQKARNAGFENVLAADSHVDSLVDLISGSLDSFTGQLVYFAGRDRTGDLEDRLAALRFHLTVLIVYQMDAVPGLAPTTVSAFDDGAVDGVLIYSRRSASVFCNLVEAAGLSGKMADVTFYALSEATAEPLRQLEAATIKVADKPEAARLTALIEC